MKAESRSVPTPGTVVELKHDRSVKKAVATSGGNLTPGSTYTVCHAHWTVDGQHILITLREQVAVCNGAPVWYPYSWFLAKDCHCPHRPEH